jgi:hypothetical protein
MLLMPLMLVYAAAGLALSLLVNLMSYVSIDSFAFVLLVLLPGIVPIWPLVLFVPNLKPGMVIHRTEDSDGDALTNSTYGCPAWMTSMVKVLLAYGFLDTLVISVLLILVARTGYNVSEPWAFSHIGSAIAIAAFSLGFAAAWSTCFARRCANGHVVPWEAQVCPECRASVDAAPF